MIAELTIVAEVSQAAAMWMCLSVGILLYICICFVVWTERGAYRNNMTRKELFIGLFWVITLSFNLLKKKRKHILKFIKYIPLNLVKSIRWLYIVIIHKSEIDYREKIAQKEKLNQGENYTTLGKEITIVHTKKQFNPLITNQNEPMNPESTKVGANVWPH